MTFLGVSRKNSVYPSKVIYLPKFMMSFLVIDLFNVLMRYFSVGAAKSLADIDTGDHNPYISPNSQYYHYFFFPRGGPNSIANFDGAMAGFVPPGSATVAKSLWLVD